MAVELSIDGGPWLTPPPSPITVTRDGSTHTYDFRATQFGLVSPVTRVTIPPATASVPDLTSVSRASVQPIDCGVEWIVGVTWTVTSPDDVNYKIRIKTFGTSTIVADNLSTVSGTWNDNTGEVGDASGSGTFHNRQYTVELVRIADDVVIEDLDTTLLTVETGLAC